MLFRSIYIEPASPWQNGFVESFHGRFRDECLNREQLWTLSEARVVIEDFRIEYNTRRPHSRLGYRSPVNYAALLPAVPTPVGLQPPSVGTALTTTDRSTHNNIPDSLQGWLENLSPVTGLQAENHLRARDCRPQALL